jgi:hypothetical protein
VGAGEEAVRPPFNSLFASHETNANRTKRFDGGALTPAYEPAKYAGPEPSTDVEGGQLYSGSCHCGAITLALKSKPIDKTYTERILECNCSICERVRLQKPTNGVEKAC